MANAAEIGRELELFVERLMTKITLDIIANLIETTPVDTGWARANWIPGLGLSDVPPAPTPSDRLAGSAEGAQGAASASVISGYEFPGIIQIGNGVPYIGALNDGHSQQAPAGFVQRGINKALTVDLAGIAT
jgi:hypothetical protein